MDLLIVSAASLFAGFVDTIVGGGGLILVPALFAVYPAAAPATLFGTNKTGAIWGTVFSAWRYARRSILRRTRCCDGPWNHYCTKGDKMAIASTVDI